VTLILDAGALIAIERNDRTVVALVRRARERGWTIIVPAGVVAQVWRDDRRQVRLQRVLTAAGVDIPPLDHLLARSVGKILGATGTNDIVDGSVAILAASHDAPVVTSDPDDLARLDPKIRVISC